ncbi:MAG: hypothetical protein ACRCX2_35935 [Paraclostridium sp.]
MKKIMITGLITMSLACGVTFADTNKLSNEEYKDMVNNHLGEMSTCIEEVKDGNEWSILFGNFNEEYVQVEIDKFEEFRDGFAALENNIKDLNLKDKQMENLNNELESSLKTVVNLFQDSISFKTELKNGGENRFAIISKMIETDDKIITKIKEESKKIESLVDNINNQLN